jgi:thiamine pyrophosphokinase
MGFETATSASTAETAGTAVVFAGGEPPTHATLADIDDVALVVAADSGLGHAYALGYPVDVLVGDLDSVSAADLERAERDGVVVERHPVAKDATDLELALDAAAARGARRIVVVGIAGGRFDHLLGNVLTLTSPRRAGIALEARAGGADLVVVRDRAELRGRVGDRCSLFALGGPATGVDTSGLRYPLRAGTLLPGSTRGVSNELVETPATVSVTGGLLLAVLPDARPEPA